MLHRKYNNNYAACLFYKTPPKHRRESGHCAYYKHMIFKRFVFVALGGGGCGVNVMVPSEVCGYLYFLSEGGAGSLVSPSPLYYRTGGPLLPHK